MDPAKTLPLILFFTAFLELVVAPLVMLKVPPRHKLVVGFAMFSGALVTAGIGLAILKGWLAA